MQQTTSETKEQLSVEVDKRLLQKVCASALKNPFFKSNKNKKRTYTRDRSTYNRTTPNREVVHDTMLENTGALQQGEINIPIPNTIVPSTAIQSTTNDQASTVIETHRGRGRGRSVTLIFEKQKITMFTKHFENF